MSPVLLIVLVLVLLIVSYSSRACKDKISFHYEKSWFSRLNNPLFWNPAVSWKNKYKDGDSGKGERFFLSTTALVFLTDGWHLFSFLELNSLQLALSILLYIVLGYGVILCFLGVKLVYGVCFNGLYDYLLK
ncbi:hypothetical protein EFA69_06495 [Rufibacter immobilis]|uniref:Uncharacterized protein n=1 Tax=Rufibacter immobilis TaxID=1348778 RepID=A0A3M9MZN3_9BACT|nr:hypothetical protein EFA69_06495 [Rufibacter immobilis]